MNLCKLSLQRNSLKEVLKAPADTAKKKYLEHKNTYVNQSFIKESSSNWPIKVLASNSIYKVSQTILLIHQSRNNQTTERLFAVIAVMTSDIICACLTNLPHVMCLNCLSSTMDQREDCMRNTVYLFGKSETILKILDQRGIPKITCLFEASWEEKRRIQLTCRMLVRKYYI